jgi:methyl-accepting chemotaxis protein
MSWKDMGVGRKIAVGFSIVIILLVVVGIVSFTGISGIVSNAKTVIFGNYLDGELAQKEVDHLNWAGQVNALLTDDNVTELDVEMDHTKCAFGKFLYGDGRKDAEREVPSLAKIFKEIEKPHQHLHESAQHIKDEFIQADQNLPAMLAAREVDHLDWISEVTKVFVNNEEALSVQEDCRLCALGKWLYGEGAREAAAHDPTMASLIEAMKEPHAKLHGSATTIRKAYAQVHPGLLSTLQSQLDDHRRWAAKVSEAVIQNQKSAVQLDHTKCAFGKFLDSKETHDLCRQFPALKSALEACAGPHQHLHESAADINKAIGGGNVEEAKRIYREVTLVELDKVAGYFGDAINAENELAAAQHDGLGIFHDETMPALEHTRATLQAVQQRAQNNLEGMAKANEIYATQTAVTLRGTQEKLNELREEAKNNIMTDKIMLRSAVRTKTIVIVLSVIAAVTGIFLAIMIARGITSVLKRIITGMSAGAEQVSSASTQVSSASQSLAQGASEQASSLEESSSALEEAAGMAKQNADNAQSANQISVQAQEAAEKGQDSMNEMTSAVSDINQSSDQISKIIKVIEEIAFQTNLLALNAAVEAARAGDAGKGFAVVAEEVRNLAKRSADAAKDTNELIGDSVEKAKKGQTIADESAKALEQIVGNVKKVVDLVGEIAAASQEQAQGIEQINTAVGQMDQVTQQNASNAEESASASEELSAQSQNLQAMVMDLSRVVGGNTSDSTSSTTSVATNKPQSAATPGHTNRIAQGFDKLTNHLVKKGQSEETQTQTPQAVIPMGDDDFKS